MIVKQQPTGKPATSRPAPTQDVRAVHAPAQDGHLHDRRNHDRAQHAGDRHLDWETCLRGRRYLVVDDHPDIRMLVRCFVTKAGGEADEAVDGREAVEIMCSDKARVYNALILDMEMPVLNGYQAASQLRKASVTTPIVALTASAMTGDLDRCLQAGCDHYLSKPIDRRKMLQLLASL